MTIWIVAIGLTVLWVVLSYFLGAIRAVVTLLGVVIAGLVAIPLGPKLQWLFTKMDVTNPFWQLILPPILVFFLVMLLGLVLAVVAELPVGKYFKLKATDIQRARYERLNPRLGAAVGTCIGFMFTVWFVAAIYPVGYLSLQYANDEKDPWWLKFVNQTRADLQNTGWDRVGAMFDYMPKNYYKVLDTLSFLYYNNPQVVNRLSMYPPLLSWQERPDIQEIVNDKEFMEFLQGKPALLDMLNHARIQAIYGNGELWNLAAALDANDFNSYLVTGKTAKYDQYKILGRWVLDSEEVVILAKKRKPDISTREMTALKKALARMAAGTTLKATTDNQLELTVKGELIDLRRLATPMFVQPRPAPAPRPTSLGAGGMSGLSAAVRARYGRPSPEPPPPQPMMQPQEGSPTPPPPPVIDTKTYRGSWEGEEGGYQLKIQDPNGKTETVDAKVDVDQLVFTAFGQQFVFLKQY